MGSRPVLPRAASSLKSGAAELAPN
jgi:hypothetical protein